MMLQTIVAVLALSASSIQAIPRAVKPVRQDSQIISQFVYADDNCEGYPVALAEAEGIQPENLGDQEFDLCAKYGTLSVKVVSGYKSLILSSMKPGARYIKVHGVEDAPIVMDEACIPASTDDKTKKVNEYVKFSCLNGIVKQSFFADSACAGAASKGSANVEPVTGTCEIITK